MKMPMLMWEILTVEKVSLPTLSGTNSSAVLLSAYEVNLTTETIFVYAILD